MSRPTGRTPAILILNSYAFKEKLKEEDAERIGAEIEKTVLETLENIVSHEFLRLSYTEAVDILQKSGETFEYPVEWGLDLQSEHERYLTEQKFKQPVILYDYPRSFKPWPACTNAISTPMTTGGTSTCGATAPSPTPVSAWVSSG